MGAGSKGAGLMAIIDRVKSFSIGTFALSGLIALVAFFLWSIIYYASGIDSPILTGIMVASILVYVASWFVYMLSSIISP